MKKTKLTNCKLELHVKVKTQSAGTKCKHITTPRRSIALRLGPNLRAIAPLETQNEIKICLPLFINESLMTCQNGLQKEQTPSCSSYFQIAREIQKFKKLLSKATASVFMQNDHPTGVLDLRSSAVQLKFKLLIL